MLRDEADLVGARTAEIAVVREHPPSARRVLLIEEQLQRLLAADEVCGAQLTGERGALAGERLLALRLLIGERDAALGMLGALASAAAPGVAHVSCRGLGIAQLPRQPVLLDLVPADLVAHALDLGLNGLQIGLGLARVARGDGGRRQGSGEHGGEHGSKHRPYNARPLPRRHGAAALLGRWNDSFNTSATTPGSRPPRRSWWPWSSPTSCACAPAIRPPSRPRKRCAS